MKLMIWRYITINETFGLKYLRLFIYLFIHPPTSGETYTRLYKIIQI